MLTARQRRFVEEYPVDLNGKEAAIRAGYAVRSAKKSAWSNLTKPDIGAAIAARQAVRLDAVAMRAEEALSALSAIGHANILDHLRVGAGRVDISIDQGKAEGLFDVSVEPFAEGRGARRRAGRRWRIRMQGKIAALDRLARHYGLYRVSDEEPEEMPLSLEEKRAQAMAVLALLVGADVELSASESPHGWATAQPPSRKRCALSASPHRSRMLPTSAFQMPNTGKPVFGWGGSSPHARRPAETPQARASGSEALLTKRQRLFVAEYLVDLNGAQAAVRAGYSARWAKEIAYQTLARPAVAAAIRRAQAKRLAALGAEADGVIGELSAIGRANLLDYMRLDAEGMPVFDLSGLDRVRAAALSEVMVEEVGGDVRRIRVRMHDKIAALDKLARHHGLYGGRETPQSETVVPVHSARQVARAVLAMVRECELR
jgi:phage terminase small subunit